MDKIIYLSYSLNEHTPAYGGKKDLIKFERINSIANGDTSNNLKLTFPTHISTHIDFPYHFDTDGKKGSDYSADFWVFNKIGFIQCDVDLIEKTIEKISSDIEILILKTGFAGYRGYEKYWREQPVLKSSLASLFRLQFPKLRVFGFDMISLTSKIDRSEGKKAHLEFLIENNILVLEDMNLENLMSCPKQVIILPLQIEDADGSPCSIIATL
jgi:arylformamidase